MWIVALTLLCGVLPGAFLLLAFKLKARTDAVADRQNAEFFRGKSTL